MELVFLALRNQAPWFWARVAGDALDLALLGLALTSHRHARGRAAAATAAVLGVTALDALAGQQFTWGGVPTAGRRRGGRIRAIKTVTINRPPGEIYRFWRTFENLPRFIAHLDEVQSIDSRRSHWRVKGPLGRRIEWDSEITDDRKNERIAWRSLAGAEVDNRGAVTFRTAPGGRGTEMRVELEYEAPAGSVGALVTSLFGQEPTQQLQADLRAFKALMEAGEIPRAESSFGLFKHAARPPQRTA